MQPKIIIIINNFSLNFTLLVDYDDDDDDDKFDNNNNNSNFAFSFPFWSKAAKEAKKLDTFVD